MRGRHSGQKQSERTENKNKHEDAFIGFRVDGAQASTTATNDKTIIIIIANEHAR